MPKSPWWLTAIIILSLLLGLSGPTILSAEAADWQGKVDPSVLSAAGEGETEFLVFLRDQPDLSATVALESKTTKGAYVYKTLSSTAESSQKALRTMLDSLGVSYRPYWVVNALWVSGDFNLIQQIAQRSDVAHVYANPQVQLSLPEQTLTTEPQAVTTIEWNIQKINADDVWGTGFTGQGVVIGGADTGYAWDHSALINQYRGWDGATASHDYNWHDATGGSPNTPADPYGHGTHTMGIMVGDDGGVNQVGVAPGAKWIGCRNMDSSGYGTPARYIECYEWFIAPYPIGGDPFTDGDPAQAPDVINNSWGCTINEGCTDPNILLTAVQNVNAAGILTVHSAGNGGSSCSSVDEPATIYEESFSVGAVNSSDTIASFSSRGPVTVDGSNRLKPNISAPGVSIRSTIPGDSYGYKQGTSMAAPHIAGVVALMISANPALAGQIDTLRTLIEETAVPLLSLTQTCGDDTPTNHPNNVYGWGRVDAWAAYQAIPNQELAIDKTVSALEAAPGSVLTYTLTVTNTEPVSNTHNVILQDTLPQYTNFITATGSYSLNNDTVIWELGDLEPGAASHVELVVQILSSAPAGSMVNQEYSTYSDEAIQVTGDPVVTYVHGLAIEKYAPEMIAGGSPLSYTLTITNLQPSVSTHHLTLTDTLPEGTEFIAATGNYSLVGDLVTWDIGDLGASSAVQVNLVVSVSLTSTATITNAHYGVVSDEVTTPAQGSPVTTFVHWPGLLWMADTACIDQWLLPGATLTCQQQLYNTGNYTDTFTLSSASTNGEVEINTSEVKLGAGQSEVITLTLMITNDAASAETITTTLTATSAAKPSLSEALTITSWVYHRLYLPLVFGRP